MAKPTIAFLQASLAAAEADAAGARTELASLQARLRLDYVERTEYSRVQGVLRSTQQFLAKYKAEARPESAGPSARRLAMEAAKAAAIATGTTVSV